MNNQKNRAWAKHLLFISRVKLIYARITLTRYTTLYFFLALLSCFTLVVLQSSTFASNTEGASAVAAFLSESNVTTKDFGLSFLEDGNVMLCQNIPGQLGADCITLVERAHAHMHVRDIALPQDPQKCAVSLMWFADVLNDARREDLVILAYQIWLFSLSVVTLLNESLPHLFAGLAARALATGWAGFRVQGDKNLYSVYQNVIQAGACGGYDPMGTWWNGDAQHGIAGLVSNVLTLVMMAALSYKLYKVYANQTFSRVGTSAEIHRIYKLVLLLSVSLQLAGFFTLAQTALWIDKISFGPIRPLAQHFPLYLAGFILTVFLEMPWLILVRSLAYNLCIARLSLGCIGVDQCAAGVEDPICALFLDFFGPLRPGHLTVYQSSSVNCNCLLSDKNRTNNTSA
ncbi:hypothetical protein DFH07DRAFT_797297 [Mycena maculata]|uniref:Uncharacterized protein n=1 Tax=Mycena maculata TaxID=230809 RepID=A0AAD7NW89_9AGAR|nr:hypothetical protein DFH07DRAFT_797297 [Mycena maculata]